MYEAAYKTAYKAMVGMSGDVLERRTAAAGKGGGMLRGERAIATIAVSEPHLRSVFCLVCHQEVPQGWHMHVTTRGWETCGYCSEGCALSYLRSVDAELPSSPEGGAG